MSSLVGLSNLRGLLRHPWQLLLAVLGVAVGVAVFVGIDLAAASSLRGFRLSAASLNGHATHEVRARAGALADSEWPRLALAFPDVDFAPVIEARVRARAHRAPDAAAPVGEGAPVERALTLLGVDPLSEAPLRPWLADFRGAREATGPASGAVALIARPRSAVISKDAAQALGVGVGDTLELRVVGRRETVEVLALLDSNDRAARVGLSDLLVVDIATAQELSRSVGSLTRLDLRIAPGLESREPALRAALGETLQLLPAAARASGIETLTDSFRLNLRALSMLALLVGLFLVYNTMSFSVLRRRQSLSTLRTLGVSRGQVFLAIVAESLWLGLAGTALGIALGSQLAKGLLALVTRTMSDLYFVASVRDVHLDDAILLRAGLLGVVATAVGALVPALEASRARPQLGLASSGPEVRLRAHSGRFAAAGVACLTIAGLAFAWPSKALTPSFVGLLALVVGFGCIAPAMTAVLARCAAPLLGWRAGALGRLAARGVEAHLTRTSVAVAALAVAISATVGMGILVTSFRATFLRWLDLTLEADVYVSAPGSGTSGVRGELDPAWVERIRALEGVADVTTYRAFDTQWRDRPVQAAAITLNDARRASFEFRDATPAQAWAEFELRDAVIVSESFGYRFDVGRGDSLELATPAGTRPFEVLGTYSDFASDAGTVLMARATFERWFPDRGIGSIGVFAKPGVDGAALTGRVRDALPPDSEWNVRSTAALREASVDVFERTFEITGVLRLFSTLVAFLGVLGALLALELDRVREVGVLRAQGVTPREVRGLVLAETGLLGAISGLIALPLGLALSLVLILVINKRSFGWSLSVHVDPWVLFGALALGIGSALLAGLWPAWRLSRIRPAAALRGD